MKIKVGVTLTYCNLFPLKHCKSVLQGARSKRTEEEEERIRNYNKNHMCAPGSRKTGIMMLILTWQTP